MEAKTHIQINLNDKLFLKNPEESPLGRKILQSGAELIDKLGFEEFTFKKLALQIKSTEATIYRYFENKHQLLNYLISFYWALIEYKIQIQIQAISKPKQKVKLVLEVLAETDKKGILIGFINETVLYNIIMNESSKSYLSKNVDEKNKDGYFREYKSLCKTISDIFLAYNPRCKYPRALASIIVETAHQQVYFAQHLPSLTELKHNKLNNKDSVLLLEHLTFKLLEQ